jgi:hypothetical protein
MNLAALPMAFVRDCSAAASSGRFDGFRGAIFRGGASAGGAVSSALSDTIVCAVAAGFACLSQAPSVKQTENNAVIETTRTTVNQQLRLGRKLLIGSPAQSRPSSAAMDSKAISLDQFALASERRREPFADSNMLPGCYSSQNATEWSQSIRRRLAVEVSARIGSGRDVFLCAPCDSQWHDLAQTPAAANLGPILENHLGLPAAGSRMIGNDQWMHPFEIYVRAFHDDDAT